MRGLTAARLPLGVLTDSYKACHFELYPPGTTELEAYACFRSGFQRDEVDTRAVWFGVEHVLEQWVHRRWTEADVDRAAAFWATHAAPGHTPYPFPAALLHRVVTECDGWFPVTIRALPAGSVVHPHVPLFVIRAVGPYAPLATWLETILTHAWYGSAVATLSRRARDAVEAAFEASADGGRLHPLLPSRLHDFGFRGATCVEAALVGGAAHLLSWDGSDTAVAAYAAAAVSGGGGGPGESNGDASLPPLTPIASSIPATEHSVMMAWPCEEAALAHEVALHGGGLHACVLDTHDYNHALTHLVPALAPAQRRAGGHFVLRPDSGDPTHAVLAALDAAGAAFGVETNGKGFRVIQGASVIQGDGVTPDSLAAMLAAVVAAGWSAENVAFGMGGGLLQKVDRDSLAFATKLCRVSHPPLAKDAATGAWGAAPGAAPVAWDVMKSPTGDEGKVSLPGRLAVVDRGGVLTAVRAATAAAAGEADRLETVWDCGPVAGRPPPPAFAEVRAALDAAWRASPKVADAVDGELRERAKAVRAAGGRAPADD